MLESTALTIILFLLGFIQLIVVGIGAWLLLTSVKILGVLEGIKIIIGNNRGDIDDLKEFQSWWESKGKEMWSWYSRTVLKRQSTELPTFKEVDPDDN